MNFNWAPLVTTWIPILLAIGAMLVSIQQTQLAKSSTEITRSTMEMNALMALEEKLGEKTMVKRRKKAALSLLSNKELGDVDDIELL